MHSRSARVSTSVSKAWARLNWTAGVWGTASHCTGGPRSRHWGRPPAIGKDHRVDVRNPATGEGIRRVEGVTAGEGEAAIERAAAAFGPWRGVAPGDRARLLRRFAAAVDAHGEELAA